MSVFSSKPTLTFEHLGVSIWLESCASKSGNQLAAASSLWHFSRASAFVAYYVYTWHYLTFANKFIICQLDPLQCLKCCICIKEFDIVWNFIFLLGHLCQCHAVFLSPFSCVLDGCCLQLTASQSRNAILSIISQNLWSMVNIIVLIWNVFISSL